MSWRRAAWVVALLWACLPRSERPATSGALDSATPADTTPTTITILPGTSDTSVAWPDFVATLRRNPDAVRAVMQTHARKVTMVMKDGRRFNTTEPTMDAVLTILREVDPANSILVATE
jgi:mitochondrial fission protein ELM1